jgi:hypothetical protein
MAIIGRGFSKSVLNGIGMAEKATGWVASDLEWRVYSKRKRAFLA